MQEIRANIHRSNLVIGFSLAATYFAAVLYLLDHSWMAFFVIVQAIFGLFCMGFTYVQIYWPSKINGRIALAVAIVPLVLNPFFLLPRLLLIYPVYRYGKACLSENMDEPETLKGRSILQDAYGPLALLVIAILLWTVNPAYFYKLGDLPESWRMEFAISLIILELISMAFMAAAHLRGRKINFAKVIAILFSLLMCILALLLFIMMPAAIVMSEQMALVHDNP